MISIMEKMQIIWTGLGFKLTLKNVQSAKLILKKIKDVNIWLVLLFYTNILFLINLLIKVEIAGLKINSFVSKIYIVTFTKTRVLLDLLWRLKGTFKLQ